MFPSKSPTNEWYWITLAKIKNPLVNVPYVIPDFWPKGRKLLSVMCLVNGFFIFFNLFLSFNNCVGTDHGMVVVVVVVGGWWWWW